MSASLPALHYRTTEAQLAFIRMQDGDTYGYHVREFLSWIGGRDLVPETVLEYYEHLADSDYSPGTVRIKRQALKKRLRQLARAHGLGSQWSVDLDQFLKDADREGEHKAPKVQTAPIDRSRYLTEDEYRLVLNACRGPKQESIIRFLWTTGCRVSEMTGIKLSDCEVQEDRVLILVTGKGNKSRKVRISPALYDELRQVFDGKRYLFETSGRKPLHRVYCSDTIAKVTRRALGRALRAHSLRHSFATRMIRQTGKIEGTSRYLGHSSPAITMSFYVHESLDDGDLFEVVA